MAVKRCLLTAEARVHSEVVARGTRDGQTSSGAGLYTSFSFPFFSFTLLIIILSLFHFHLSPLHDVCNSLDQKAHY
jgi:hypothetical protein